MKVGKKIKIVHVQLLPLLSGVQRVSLQEFLLLNSDRYEKILICKEPGDLTKESEKVGVKCFYVPSLVRNISPFKDFKSFINLLSLFKYIKADIVHTHSAKTGVLGRIAAKLAGVPIVIHTVHGFSFESTNNKAISFVYKFVEFVSAFFSDRIICLHNEDKKKCINILKVPKEKICILPNGVDLDKFHPVEEKQKILLRANFNLQHASLIFTMVGRLWDQKNPLLLVQAAQKYLRCNSESNDVFILVGDGDLRIKIEELAAKEINAGKIILLGWRNDIAEILSLSDVFILPSKWEGMPLAILEAQAAGLPCIASDIAGNKSLIKDNINGILFKNDSVNSLLTKIKLMSLADERKRISHNAMDIVKKDHCIQSRIKEIESLYESLLN